MTTIKVKKKSGRPFASGYRVNTVKEATMNPNTGKMAYTFVEDNSIVDIEQLVECKGLDTHIDKMMGGMNKKFFGEW